MKQNSCDPVEVSSDEEGLREAWFYAKLLKKHAPGFIVDYRDIVSNEDEVEQLREKADNCHLRTSPLEHGAE